MNARVVVTAIITGCVVGSLALGLAHLHVSKMAPVPAIAQTAPSKPSAPPSAPPSQQAGPITTSPSMNAPGGMNITGGTVNNPTIINSPPADNLSQKLDGIESLIRSMDRDRAQQERLRSKYPYGYTIFG